MDQHLKANYHDEVSAYYDEDASLGFETRAMNNQVLDRIRNDFRRITEGYDFQNALEIGCGPGFDVAWFASRYPGRQFTAVDISEGMVKLAADRVGKYKLSNAHILRADERSLLREFGKEAFDMIYVYFGALNTAEDLGFAANQIGSLLKPGGYAVLTFVNKWYLRELLVQLAKLRFRAAFARLRPVWGGYSVDRFLPSRCYSACRIRRAFGSLEMISKKGYSILFPAWYNHHKIINNPSGADKLWRFDEKLQKTPLWSLGEYTLFVFRRK